MTTDLYTMNSNGSEMTRLTTIGYGNFEPVWSPDGSQIAFTHDKGEYAEIYVMNADGSNIRNLTNNTGQRIFDVNPAWSADGKQIAFLSQQERGAKAAIYIMNADGSDRRLLVRDTVFEAPSSVRFAWSPDGEKIAFSYPQCSGSPGVDIVLVSSDGTNLRKLLTLEQYGPFELCWSPDSKYLAYGTFYLREGMFVTSIENPKPVALTGDSVRLAGKCAWAQ